MFAEGSDGFSINHCMENEKQGCLLIAHSSIKIGAKEYRMRSTNERNIYKIKGGIVKLVFNENKELVSVQIRQYNQAYRFDKKYDFE